MKEPIELRPEGENVLMFAARDTHRQPAIIDDPLEELLNEFSDMEEMLENKAAPQEEIDEPSEEPDVHAMSESELMEFVNLQIGKLKESRDRLKYYLDEIEVHLPG